MRYQLRYIRTQTVLREETLARWHVLVQIRS